MTDNLHHRILATLTRRYEQRIMNNVCCSDYVECMVASIPGADRRLTWADGRDWGAPGLRAHADRYQAGNQAGRGKTVMGSWIRRGPAAAGFRHRGAPGLLAAGRRSMDRGAGPPCAPLRLCLARAPRRTCRPPQRRTVAVPCCGGKRPAFRADEHRPVTARGDRNPVWHSGASAGDRHGPAANSPREA